MGLRDTAGKAPEPAAASGRFSWLRVRLWVHDCLQARANRYPLASGQPGAVTAVPAGRQQQQQQ